MESLLANYASSDEEEDQQQQQPPPKRTALPPKPSSQLSSTSSLFSSLPKSKPQNPSFFQSLPKPKQTLIPKSQNLGDDDEDPIDSIPTSKPSSVFSSLPPPKSRNPIQPITNLSSSDQNPRKIVQFNPPINSYKYDEDEEDDEEKETRRRKASESLVQKLSAKSFLSSLSAPRYSSTLGASAGLGSGSGSGSGSSRRAIVETESVGSRVESGAGVEQNVESHEKFQSNSEQSAVNYEGYGGSENYQSTIDQNAVNYESYGGYEGYQSGIDRHVDAGVQLHAGVSGSDPSNYGNYDGYGGYAGYEQQYGNDWVGGSGTVVPTIPATGVSEIKVGKKRGRYEVPTEIIEVKQDELMKNRPREDQAKLTGIAFGPSYQPVSTKAKPTKLHKRKHQIGSLYFDMKQKEMELAERRSRGFLTKAETHAKYGW
ncbi:hypothetical protein ACFX13_013262 [Malus domestica]|uniref:Proline-rich protein PRCC n=1 Tax=Malus domestica TaxID=3750 RepID=A0A498IBT0_MALDO|nr:hypothetical protein DVH24_002091 [Malus domestica]